MRTAKQIAGAIVETIALGVGKCALGLAELLGRLALAAGQWGRP